MDKMVEKPKGKDGVQANSKLPAEIVGRFMQDLSVGDRLKSERVSPLWKWALQKWGWTEQRKLDASIVSEGASEEEIARFWDVLNDGSCQFVSLLHGCGPRLRELDLFSFERGGIRLDLRFLPQIAESLISGLEKLDIWGLYLQDFLEHLPSTLRVLKASFGVSVETLQVISERCPNLKEVPFEYADINNNLDTIETIVNLIGKFPRQKKLNLHWLNFPAGKVGALASIAELKELEELEVLHSYGLDGESLEAIVGGCQRLRSLSLQTDRLTENELFQLAKMPNLVALDIRDRFGEFTDAVLKAIAQRRQLKKLTVCGVFGEDGHLLTDASIVYLVDRCKSLVSLKLLDCPQVTERSLEAIVAEVHRRHGTPPRSLPSGPLDEGIFYFQSSAIGIERKRIRELIGENPWIRFGDDNDPRKIT